MHMVITRQVILVENASDTFGIRRQIFQQNKRHFLRYKNSRVFIGYRNNDINTKKEIDVCPRHFCFVQGDYTSYKYQVHSLHVQLVIIHTLILRQYGKK